MRDYTNENVRPRTLQNYLRIAVSRSHEFPDVNGQPQTGALNWNVTGVLRALGVLGEGRQDKTRHGLPQGLHKTLTAYPLNTGAAQFYGNVLAGLAKNGNTSVTPGELLAKYPMG